ncbi:hypothetical protein KR093_007401, partial [Drosophila rubida]
ISTIKQIAANSSSSRSCCVTVEEAMANTIQTSESTRCWPTKAKGIPQDAGRSTITTAAAAAVAVAATTRAACIRHADIMVKSKGNQKEKALHESEVLELKQLPHVFLLRHRTTV